MVGQVRLKESNKESTGQLTHVRSTDQIIEEVKKVFGGKAQAQSRESSTPKLMNIEVN